MMFAHDYATYMHYRIAGNFRGAKYSWLNNRTTNIYPRMKQPHKVSWGELSMDVIIICNFDTVECIVESVH